MHCGTCSLVPKSLPAGREARSARGAGRLHFPAGSAPGSPAAGLRRRPAGGRWRWISWPRTSCGGGSGTRRAEGGSAAPLPCAPPHPEGTRGGLGLPARQGPPCPGLALFLGCSHSNESHCHFWIGRGRTGRLCASLVSLKLLLQQLLTTLSLPRTPACLTPGTADVVSRVLHFCTSAVFGC